MIKSKEKQSLGIEIDLTGPQGNAYFLLGTASKLGRQLGLDSDEIEVILRNMRSSDYENLVNVFDRNFGNIVTLYR
jgi:alanine-alpha-ketoisovalerate/valine-pyruvate aminotransferase